MPLHVAKYRHGLMKVSKANTHVDEAIVQNLIRPLLRRAIAFKLVEQLENLYRIRIAHHRLTTSRATSC